MWFKNLFIFRLNQWQETPASLEEKLMNQAMQGCGSSDMQTRGWVSPKGEDHALVYKLGDQLLISLGIEKKLLPASVINQFTKARAAEIQEREGYKPGRKQMKEIKETITDELMPRAFNIQSRINAWIDMDNQWLVIDSANPGKVDEFMGMLIKSISGIGVSLVKTKISPTVAMTTWLAEKDSPSSFSIDQDCELKSRGEQAATVRYVKHTLEEDEIAKHIQRGKDVTQLGMTWDNKVSFVLHENLQIKRLSPLDIIKEHAALNGDDDAFDTHFALMTGELRRLLPNLINALGGELTQPKATRAL